MNFTHKILSRNSGAWLILYALVQTSQNRRRGRDTREADERLGTGHQQVPDLAIRRSSWAWTKVDAMMEQLTSGWLLLTVPGLIWGASFLFMAEGLRSIGPSGVCFVRICIGFATLGLFRSARRPVAPAHWGSVAWLGLLWFAFPLSMFPFAEQRVSSALTGMLNGANPLFATLVACYLARRAPSRGVAVGLTVGLAGTVLIALPAVDSGHSSAIGIGLILAALISYGFALSIARSLQQRYGAVPVIWRARLF